MDLKTAKILIVDDEPDICRLLCRLVESEGYTTITAHDGKEALEKIRQYTPDVVLSDLKMPHMNGLEVLNKSKGIDPDLPVILITAFADVHGAVEAMRLGAHDYLSKPFDHNEVVRVLQRACQERRLKNKIKQLSLQLDQRVHLRKLMGHSEQVGDLLMQINRVAKSDFSVIIQGETGSGKELVSTAIYQASNRSHGPFIALDCGAITETLLESELFGHEKGSFTGAMQQKMGKFEAANDGTLFLDEIFNMSMGSQAKLLRALQERRIYRVGGTTPIPVNVRILAATNRDLETCSPDVFRKDLFFRLNDFIIRIPPLRERPDDIPYLSKRFLDSTNVMLQKNIKGFSSDAMNRLITYQWPGNVRQLKSTVRRAVLMADEEITEKHLDLNDMPQQEMAGIMPEQDLPSWEGRPLKEIIKQNTSILEKKILTKILQQVGGNKAKAARRLKIDYKTIHTKLKNYGISINGD
ncbi:two-component system, NtrC family, nitrogen regulation response regulator GlnG [Desulfocicer vacuolatum DSM 3385]|uniref:Two-component system, NtrC family, nitrogen regulation response regulator GlnG n=1 Tax=Desulfocicer vacuolatum DSM 3385 TaxID=1121400 RepID=A0A1W2BDN8_9BACT|nr:sigma-54 dependent transcriptional regulator [Desulfocicer vacuolatum]SMC71143.1 two-component system, NtrC family, nitrogen regulation response regulator GlnG [Desulfocicer vacuolatum DSM 3385]